MTTASDLLAATNAAILATLTSQEYDLPGGQRQKRARLAELNAFRKDLANEVAAESESGGSMASLGMFSEAIYQ